MATISQLSRRAFLEACGALAAGGVGGTLSAQEVSPVAPAHHARAVGAHELIVLSDGHLVIPLPMLAINAPSSEVKGFLGGRGLGPDRVNFHINVALLKTGNEQILIDAGSGGTWLPTAGRLAESLEAARIAPETIGKVVLTHAHPDHLWGLIDELDNSLRFPRAQYLVSARELAFWTGGEADLFRGPVEAIAAGAKRVFKAIAERTQPIKPGAEIAPGLVALDTAGHTPGHISVLLTSGSAALLVTADAVQNNHIALAHPDWWPAADMDGGKAAANRRKLLDMAATDKLQVLCYHMPFPGLGRVERQGAAFAWVADP
jgi:glyoxylase-like metal-dependent hydrolase (beta-lactamase superfamily II)